MEEAASKREFLLEKIEVAGVAGIEHVVPGCAAAGGKREERMILCSSRNGEGGGIRGLGFFGPEGDPEILPGVVRLGIHGEGLHVVPDGLLV